MCVCVLTSFVARLSGIIICKAILCSPLRNVTFLSILSWGWPIAIAAAGNGKKLFNFGQNHFARCWMLDVGQWYCLRLPRLLKPVKYLLLPHLCTLSVLSLLISAALISVIVLFPDVRFSFWFRFWFLFWSRLGFQFCCWCGVWGFGFRSCNCFHCPIRHFMIFASSQFKFNFYAATELHHFSPPGDFNDCQILDICISPLEFK